MTDKIFKLIDFSPIGFKQINYPVQFCSLCRGKLVDVCGNCFENNITKCDVINTNDTYYHLHCYKMIETSEKKPSEQSDTDSDASTIE